jgi:hypothetical protein
MLNWLGCYGRENEKKRARSSKGTMALHIGSHLILHWLGQNYKQTDIATTPWPRVIWGKTVSAMQWKEWGSEGRFSQFASGQRNLGSPNHSQQNNPHLPGKHQLMYARYFKTIPMLYKCY